MLEMRWKSLRIKKILNYFLFCLKYVFKKQYFLILLNKNDFNFEMLKKILQDYIFNFISEKEVFPHVYFSQIKYTKRIYSSKVEVTCQLLLISPHCQVKFCGHEQVARNGNSTIRNESVRSSCSHTWGIVKLWPGKLT